MDSQVADSPQAPTISVHTLQQLFKICDDVAAQLRNGAPYLVVPFESLLPLGDHAFEVLKDRLEYVLTLCCSLSQAKTSPVERLPTPASRSATTELEAR